MEKIYCERINEVKKEKYFLEKRLNVKIEIDGRFAIVNGDSMNEYDFSRIIEAINVGFSSRTASLILDGDYIYEKINIKKFTTRKNLDLIRGRLIGAKGKTKRTMEEITGAVIKVKDNTVSVICRAEDVDYITNSIIRVIKGTKHSNVYRYLETVKSKRKYN